MRTNRNGPSLWRPLAASTLGLAIMLTVGTAMSATPSTTAYHFSSHPMISGTVVSVNDHQMVVATDQGEQVPLELDTRTLAPRDLAPGMVMRVEFLALEDCRLYAQRVVPVRDGTSTNRTQAYANTQDSRETLARSTSSPWNYRSGEIEVRGANGATPTQAEQNPPGPIMTAKPSTADYHFSTRPMMSGRVVSVNDHLLVVTTLQGQQVGVVMDSRTMVPGEVAPGMDLRVDFTQMKDGRYYAKRVSPNLDPVVDREQAYAHTHDSDMAIASNSGDCGYPSSGAGNSMSSDLERRGSAGQPDVAVAQVAPVPGRPETLPQTASHQPLILLIGLFAVGSAGLLMAARALRIV